VRQLDVAHGSNVNPAYAHVASLIQAFDVVELRLQLVRRAEEILLAPDNKDAACQNCQGRNDESS
jgi:hypothetical protein